MADKNFYYLGTLTKPFGLKGALCAFFDVDDCERYLDLDAVFIETEGEMLPYMIEDLQFKGNNQFVIKLQDVDMDNVREFVQTDLYLPLSRLPKLSGNRFYFHEVIGFKVVDEKLGEMPEFEWEEKPTPIITLRRDILPMMRFAARDDENICSVACESYILEHRGIPFEFKELVETARKKNWLKNEGTPLYAIGQLLAMKGLLITRKYDASIDDLIRVLALDTDVSVAVDI